MKTGLLGALVVSALLWTSQLRADETYFRGDQGRATDESGPLPEKFDETEIVWQVDLPPGNSSPCVCGDKIFLTTFVKADNQLATVAIDRASGKLLWRQIAPAEKIEAFHPVGSPATCTPACDGERVFVFFGSYGLLCYDLEGKLLWSKKMGPFQDEFGASSSPVLIDDKIILNEDHDIDSFITAIDKQTGETAWRTSREGFTRSYSTPIVWESAAGKQIVVAGSLQLAAYDPNDGKKLWWVNGLSRILDTTPAQANGQLFVATWTPGGDEGSRISMGPFADALKTYDKNADGLVGKNELAEGAVLERFFRIDLNQDQKLSEEEWNKHARVFELAQNVAMAVKPGGTGDVTETNVKWKYGRSLPTVASPLVYRGAMYMVKDGGIITSLDAETGEMLAQGRAEGAGNYYASPVAGDGKVYFASERGVITILRAGREWETLGSRELGQRIMATPVIQDGKIYLRTDDALYCFAVQ